MSAEMTATERVTLLEQLQEQDANRRRKAVFAAWGSVGMATLLLAVLVFGASWYLRDARDELARITDQRDAAATELRSMIASRASAEQALRKVQAELSEKQAQLAAVTQALGNVPEAQRRAALEKKLSDDPKAARLLPRAYVQIVDAEDRAWAKEMVSRLEGAGIIVPGIELVPKAVGLVHSDVRYYKKAEREGAEKIVALLKSFGVDASPNYLDEEDNTKVRANHYEVWFAAGSRNTALR